MSSYNEYNEISLIDMVRALQKRYVLFLTIFFCSLILALYCVYEFSYSKVKISRKIEVAHFYSSGSVAYPIAGQSADSLLEIFKPILHNNPILILNYLQRTRKCPNLC